MMQVKEIRDWLNTLQPTDLVGIDEGGLCLQVWEGSPVEVQDSAAYLEVGGLPDVADGDGPPPYDAATATGMYDRGDAGE